MEPKATVIMRVLSTTRLLLLLSVYGLACVGCCAKPEQPILRDSTVGVVSANSQQNIQLHKGVPEPCETNSGEVAVSEAIRYLASRAAMSGDAILVEDAEAKLVSDDVLRSIEDFPPSWSVTGLFLHGLITKEDLGKIAALPGSITLLNLNQSTARVTYGQLLRTRSLRNIEVLGLNCAVLTGDDFSAMAKLSRLKRLRLTSTNTDDHMLELLTGLSSLEYLFLDDTAVTNASVDVIVQLRSLVWIDVSGTRVSASGIRRLLTLPRLEHIVANEIDVDEATSDAAREQGVELYGANIIVPGVI